MNGAAKNVGHGDPTNVGDGDRTNVGHRDPTQQSLVAGGEEGEEVFEFEVGRVGKGVADALVLPEEHGASVCTEFLRQ